ncbi:hypothetical protein CTI12_AA329750 [Artemisia annua]|uniref:Uncharacterized protein n=1 Tax=Artemisia annua TaxID=35608 RepID=A0A2U1MY54_ARTAN|nr:hypothetical protein CTI12_AA329750 [Artemisia annua]
MTTCSGDNSVREPPVDDLLNGSCGKRFGLGVRRGNCVVVGVMTACFGDNSVRAPPVDDLLNGFCGKRFGLGVRRGNCAVLADSFASVSLSAQLGTFQNMFLDLTRVQALIDFSFASTFLSGATHMINNG